MEKELRSDPLAFAELERNSTEFRRFAYKTHIAAYCESGWGNLPLSDNQAIAISVDRFDLVRGTGTSISISSKCGSLKDAWDSLPFP